MFTVIVRVLTQTKLLSGSFLGLNVFTLGVIDRYKQHTFLRVYFCMRITKCKGLVENTVGLVVLVVDWCQKYSIIRKIRV